MNNLSILFWKFVRYLVVKTYGDDCFLEKEYEEECAGCKAAKALEFIDYHIDMLKWDYEKEMKIEVDSLIEDDGQGTN